MFMSLYAICEVVWLWLILAIVGVMYLEQKFVDYPTPIIAGVVLTVEDYHQDFRGSLHVKHRYIIVILRFYSRIFYLLGVTWIVRWLEEFIHSEK